MKARLTADGTVTQHLPNGAEAQIEPRTDWSAVDAATEAGIARHAAEDDNPEGAARTLLRLIDHAPHAVLQALGNGP